MKKNKEILVLTTCYPLSDRDISAIFLRTLYENMADRQRVNITILAADHAEAEKHYEKRLGSGFLKVVRYRYFFKQYEQLLYGDAVLSNLKKNRFLYLLLPFFMISFFFTAVLTLSRQRFALIHAHWALPSGLVAVVLGKLYGIPVMVTSHGGDVYGLRSFLSRRLLAYVFRNAQCVNAVSEPLKKEILIIEPESNVFVLSMGVDENLFRPVEVVCEDHGFCSDDVLLLFVGRFSEKKGIEYLLEALSCLVSQDNRYKLILIGKGNLENKLRQSVQSLALDRHVVFMGAVENHRLPQYYALADLVVVPSVDAVGGKEGLGLTIIEALLCGKRIIASKVGGIATFENFKAVTLVPQKNSKELAAAIKSKIDDDAEIFEIARSEGLHFSISGVATGFVEKYNELIDFHEKSSQWGVRESFLYGRIQGKSVLDVGSIGQTGSYSLWNFLVCHADDIIGVDLPESPVDAETEFSVDQHHLAHKNDPKIVYGNIEWVELGRTFDIVVAGDVIEHVSNQGLMLDNIKKHLSANGELIITTPNAKWLTVFLKPNKSHVLWHDRYTLTQLLHRHGYRIAEIRYYCGNKPHYGLLKRLVAYKRGLLVVANLGNISIGDISNR
jgi:glycosyltransferase involved in cell wall biosynthesis